MPNMQLNNISGAASFLQVERGGQPPPVDVYDQGPIDAGDAIIPAAGVYAMVENTDENNAMIVSMDDDPATVEVDWTYVLQVDEYYNTATGRYDRWITTTDEVVFIIRG